MNSAVKKGAAAADKAAVLLYVRPQRWLRLAPNIPAEPWQESARILKRFIPAFAWEDVGASAAALSLSYSGNTRDVIGWICVRQSPSGMSAAPLSSSVFRL